MLHIIMYIFFLLGTVITPAEKNKPPYQELLDVAHSIDHAIHELRKLQYADKKPRIQPSFSGPSMTTIVSIEWQGGIEMLLKNISEKIKYQLQITGTQPIIPVLVSIQSQSQTINQVFRDLCAQIYPQAIIYAHDKEKIIELHYLPLG